MSTRDQQSDRERTAAASETNESAPSFLDEEHDASWSANLEQERYADDRETLIEHALAAINRTEPDYHVNLVTHLNHGTPGGVPRGADPRPLPGRRDQRRRSVRLWRLRVSRPAVSC